MTNAPIIGPTLNDFRSLGTDAVAELINLKFPREQVLTDCALCG